MLSHALFKETFSTFEISNGPTWLSGLNFRRGIFPFRSCFFLSFSITFLALCDGGRFYVDRAYKFVHLFAIFAYSTGLLGKALSPLSCFPPGLRTYYVLSFLGFRCKRSIILVNTVSYIWRIKRCVPLSAAQMTHFRHHFSTSFKNLC